MRTNNRALRNSLSKSRKKFFWSPCILHQTFFASVKLAEKTSDVIVKGPRAVGHNGAMAKPEKPLKGTSPQVPPGLVDKLAARLLADSLSARK